MKRFSHAMGLALVLSVAACSKTPSNTVVGDLATFKSREAAVFAQFSREDQAAFANLQTVHKVMSATPSKMIDGTDATWGGVSEMTATQAVSTWKKFYAFTLQASMAKKAEFDRANAEKQRKVTAERAAEKRRMALIPHIVTEWPRRLYCQVVPAAEKWLPEQAEKGLKDGAAFRMDFHPGNVNVIPLVDGKHVGPEFQYEHNQGYYSYFGNGTPGGHILKDHRLDLVSNWNLKKDWQTWQSEFFQSMISGPLTRAYTVPVKDEPEMVEEGYTFTLTGTNSAGSRELTLGCRTHRLSDEAQAIEDARARAAAEAEARRPRTPNERLVESIEAKGGICTTIGQHLRVHMHRAEQTGDWSRFQETLGKGSEVGC